MKQQSLINQSSNQSTAADMLMLSQDEEHKQHASGDLDKVVKSFKTGFGSIMGIFGDQKGKKDDKKPSHPTKGGKLNTSEVNVSVDSQHSSGGLNQ